MKNKEFYKEEIFEIACEHSKVAVVDGEPANCRSLHGCTSCDFYISEGRCKDGFKDWLEKEHEEQKIQPEVKNLKKDDRVLISADGATWYKRYFKRYDEETGTVETYQDGRTSWSAEDLSSRWTYAKLPEDEPKEEPKEEQGINWSKVPVDAKIFVKQFECEEWVPRHFAKYENRAVFAWTDGCTSHTTKATIKWTNAKLAEGEE